MCWAIFDNVTFLLPGTSTYGGCESARNANI